MSKERSTEMNTKIGASEHLAYAIGAGGININTVLVATYLLVYYTNVAGISAGLATSVIAVSKLLDGVSDLIMGNIIDHTHTSNGKARPWLIRMILPMFIASMAVFYVPSGFNGFAQAVYIFITYNLANTVCYTALAVSFESLNGFMTTNQKSRGLNGGLKLIANALTTVLIASLILNLARVFGGGELYTQRGWTLTILVFMIAFAVMTWIGYRGTQERVDSLENAPEDHTGGTKPDNNDVSAARSLAALLKNKYWLMCIITVMTINIMMILSGGSTIYFAEFVLNDVDLQATISSVMNLALIPSAVVSIALMSKFGKRNLMLFGMFITFVSSLIPLFSLSPAVCVIAAALKGASFGLTGAPSMSIVQDAITYGLWKNGFINIGMGNAANAFATKIGSSLGTILIGSLLELGGFVSGAAVQSTGAISMISTLYIWVPAIISAINIVIMFFYDLDKFYPQIEADLKEGKFAPEAGSR